ncbi:MAG TPA: methyltransferase domain-containing protein, partial [Roseiarcus sp.]|nr:methyltransferase domain-containing protein [Roseiarcus sp.]
MSPIAFLLDEAWKRPALWERLRRAIRLTGYDTTDWLRTVMYREAFRHVETLKPETLDALEISAGNQWSRAFRFRSYEATAYPAFDICAEILPRQFDLVIADQVFEHLKWPYRAGRNVYDMLKPGGTFILATPFLVRVHRVPIDCSRWT